MNGYLEFSEYIKCLEETPGLGLTKAEIISLTMAADENQDKKIDFEEFMKHFSGILDMIHFNKVLADLYLDIMGDDRRRL